VSDAAAILTHPWLDPHFEATIIEPFVAWLETTQRKGTPWARQCASPLRQLLRERPEEELLRIPAETLADVSAWAGRSKANGKYGRRSLRLFREWRGLSP
jgi:hypothetical protein